MTVKLLIRETSLKSNFKFKMNLIKKIPLELNQISKIVLITLFDEKIDISVNLLYKEFSSFG